MKNIFNDLTDFENVYAQGDAPANLPNSFYTVSEDASVDNLNGDNQTLEILYEFTLYFYTKDANALYTGLQEAIDVLKAKGYIISGVGYRSPSYKEWYAREVDVKFIEHLERN